MPSSPLTLKSIVWRHNFQSYRPLFLPVMLILADHLEVPSSTLCFICFMCVTWVDLMTPKTSWMSSKISGLFLSLIFMRSFSTIIMFWVRSSAPCLELFSAAPGSQKQEMLMRFSTRDVFYLLLSSSHRNINVKDCIISFDILQNFSW